MTNAGLKIEKETLLASDTSFTVRAVIQVPFVHYVESGEINIVFNCE